jgi:cellulose synthase/poly-beta-1,6-N-acetylglucosamine synthase-like glycosyltransferase
LILPNFIMEIMDFLFIARTFVISAYLVRHYIFTVTVLRRSKIDKVQRNTEKVWYEPTVSILIPAHNEQEIIGKLLEKVVNCPIREVNLKS